MMQIEINDMQAMLIEHLLPEDYCEKCPFCLPCDDYANTEGENGDLCDDLHDKIVRAWEREHGRK